MPLMSRRSTASAQDFDEASPQSWLSSFLGRGIASRGQANLTRYLRRIAFTASMFVLLSATAPMAPFRDRHKGATS
jgi:hypothetical protein